MTLKELQKKHPDLRYDYGDSVFRRSVWAPFFENLHESKVIYRERFICLARIDDLEMDERGVRGTVIPLQFLRKYPHLIIPSRPWRFGGSWEHMWQGDVLWDSPTLHGPSGQRQSWSVQSRNCWPRKMYQEP